MNIEEAIDSWYARIDSVSAKVESEFVELSHEKLNWKPSVKEWSIAEVLEHLILVNRSYEVVLNDASKNVSNPGLTAKIPGVVKWFGNAILKSVEPSRSKRIKTFSVWEPAKSEVRSEVLHEFIDLQDRLKVLIGKNKKGLVEDMVIPSPANRLIVYRLRTAVEIVVTHEERHLNQALAIKDKMPTHV